jgi:predicted aminopeptidase
MKRYLVRSVLLGLLILMGACSPTYVLRAGYEQARILHRRQPIVRLIEDPRTDPDTRAKLMLVLAARDFAAEQLQLDVGQSYTTYSWVESDTLLHVLSGSRKDAFEAYTWWFPIVGRVPYKGYFDAREAERERQRLERRGLDTYLRPAGAFSTLGWFNDPLLSTLLRADVLQLANTVIHEVTHNTFYAPGQARFNESFATFVGGRGAILFFCRRDGPESSLCGQAKGAWQDDLLFGRFLSTLVTDLEALYDREDLSPEQKIQQREAVFASARQRFREELQPQFRVLSFASFERLPLNNATLVGRRLYYHRLDLFDEVFELYGHELALTIQGVIAAARGSPEDPYAGVEALLAERSGGGSRSR